MIRIGTDVQFAFAMLLSIVIAAAIQLCYMTHIPQGGNQEDYIIDPYYYMHLGETVARRSSFGQGSLYALSEEYQPNVESRGVVFLNAILYRLLPSWYCLPLFFGAIYFSLFYLLYRLHLFNSTVLLFPFYTLYLDMFVPSKAAFLFIGIILLLIACLKCRLWLLGIVGIGLMFIARPATVPILLIAFCGWYCARKRIRRYAVIVGFGILYLGILRMALFHSVVAVQTEFFIRGQGTGVTFCKVGPLSVCVSSLNTFEIVLAQRLFTLLFLPVKWVWNALQLLWEDYGRMTIFNIYKRLSLVVSIVLAGIIVLKNKKPAPCVRQVRNLMLWFAAVYFVSYGTVVYYQPTRQMVVVSTIVLLTLSMTSENNEGICATGDFNQLVEWRPFRRR